MTIPISVILKLDRNLPVFKYSYYFVIWSLIILLILGLFIHILEKHRYIFGFFPGVLFFILFIVNHNTRVYTYTICNDNTISYSTGSGACSYHGGVKDEIWQSIPADPETKDVIRYLFFCIMIGIPTGFAFYAIVQIVYEKYFKQNLNLG